jgi:hypothetical protein
MLLQILSLFPTCSQINLGIENEIIFFFFGGVSNEGRYGRLDLKGMERGRDEKDMDETTLSPSPLSNAFARGRNPLADNRSQSDLEPLGTASRYPNPLPFFEIKLE